MLEVDIDKILPVTEARDNFNKIIDDVGGTEHMYVLTKNGKPSAVVVGVNHLEKLTGKSADELTSIVEKKADATPVVEEVKSKLNSPNDNVAGGSKPLETLADSGAIPSESRGKTDTATGQSIQSGNSSASPVQSSTLRDEPTGSDSNESESGGPIDVPPVPTESMTPPSAAPTSSPGSVAASSSVVASNQAPAPPNHPPTGGVAASDSDLFV